MTQSYLCVVALLFPLFKTHLRMETQLLCVDTRISDVFVIQRRERTIKMGEIDGNFNHCRFRCVVLESNQETNEAMC